MRVISGTYRGRRIDAPPESVTRPTADRVREALFSSLESLRGGLEGACVLDAFAGSGAMAIEALSRGAEHAHLVERDQRAYKVIGKNLRDLGIGADKATLKMADAFSCIPAQHDAARFDIVFLDPPYACEPEDILALMDAWVRSGTIADDALFLYEHDACASQAADIAYERSAYALIKRRSYGRVVVDTLKQDICANI